MTLINVDRLVVSSLSLANEALAAGYDARMAQTRAAARRTQLTRMLARPLPENERERGWATTNRATYQAETEQAEADAAELLGEYRRLHTRLRLIRPDLADDVDRTVWHGGVR